MDLQRLYDRLEQQDERAAEFREEMLERLGAVDSRLARLEARYEGAMSTVRAFAWAAGFVVAVAGIVVAVVACQ